MALKALLMTAVTSRLRMNSRREGALGVAPGEVVEELAIANEPSHAAHD
jgi:hypothetical protein